MLENFKVLQNLQTNMESTTKEKHPNALQTHKLVKLKKLNLMLKLKELDSWKNQNVYIGENNISHSGISTRWALSKRILNGKK